MSSDSVLCLSSYFLGITSYPILLRLCQVWLDLFSIYCIVTGIILCNDTCIMSRPYILLCVNDMNFCECQHCSIGIYLSGKSTLRKFGKSTLGRIRNSILARKECPLDYHMLPMVVLHMIHLVQTLHHKPLDREPLVHHHQTLL